MMSHMIRPLRAGEAFLAESARRQGETVEAAGFRITAVPAAHEAIERDAQGGCSTWAT